MSIYKFKGKAHPDVDPHRDETTHCTGVDLQILLDEERILNLELGLRDAISIHRTLHLMLMDIMNQHPTAYNQAVQLLRKEQG